MIVFPLAIYYISSATDVRPIFPQRLRHVSHSTFTAQVEVECKEERGESQCIEPCGATCLQFKVYSYSLAQFNRNFAASSNDCA